MRWPPSRLLIQCMKTVKQLKNWHLRVMLVTRTAERIRQFGHFQHTAAGSSVLAMSSCCQHARFRFTILFIIFPEDWIDHFSCYCQIGLSLRTWAWVSNLANNIKSFTLKPQHSSQRFGCSTACYKSIISEFPRLFCIWKFAFCCTEQSELRL